MINLIGSLLLRSRRWMVQLASLVITNAYFFPWFKRVPCLYLNCYSCPGAIFACPIGTLQNLTIDRIIPMYTLGIIGLTGVLANRLSCGWFCPFGFLQDLFHRIKFPKLRISNRFGWSRYLVLAVLVGILPVIMLEPVFCELCPAGVLEAGIPLVLLEPSLRDMIGWFFYLKLAILGFFLVAMAAVHRPFCRFVCPLGAIYSITGRFSRFRLNVDQEKCIKCNKCQKVCPVDIKIYENPASSQCIRCLECIKACPVEAIKL